MTISVKIGSNLCNLSLQSYKSNLKIIFQILNWSKLRSNNTFRERINILNFVTRNSSLKSIELNLQRSPILNQEWHQIYLKPLISIISTSLLNTSKCDSLNCIFSSICVKNPILGLFRGPRHCEVYLQHLVGLDKCYSSKNCSS